MHEFIPHPSWTGWQASLLDICRLVAWYFTWLQKQPSQDTHQIIKTNIWPIVHHVHLLQHVDKLYNLPSWECMEESNLMMALLIPDTKFFIKEFDCHGDPHWRVYSLTFGREHVLMMLFIVENSICLLHPALSMLVGQVMKGYCACVCCKKKLCSKKLGNKICYIHWALSSFTTPSIENKL